MDIRLRRYYPDKHGDRKNYIETRVRGVDSYEVATGAKADLIDARRRKDLRDPRHRYYIIQFDDGSIQIIGESRFEVYRIPEKARH